MWRRYPRSPPFSLRLELVSSLWIVRDVERMIACRELLVVPALHHEGVSLASHHVDLGDEEAVNVPGDAPANVPSDC